jgi:hypothetical protein
VTAVLVTVALAATVLLMAFCSLLRSVASSAALAVAELGDMATTQAKLEDVRLFPLALPVPMALRTTQRRLEAHLALVALELVDLAIVQARFRVHVCFARLIIMHLRIRPRCSATGRVFL